MLRVKSPQDLGAGLVFLMIGGAGLYFGSDLTFGSSARMGPGYFPTLLSILIIAIGLAVGGARTDDRRGRRSSPSRCARWSASSPPS